MAQVVYSGALPSKKKSELQEIALALSLSDQGTKDEIHTRIKKHLDKNHEELEENPTFSGLFGRKRRTGSLIPQPSQPPSTRFAPAPPPPATSTTTEIIDSPKPPSSVRRPLDPISEGTPVKDVSQFLKHPFSPVVATPESSPRPNEPAPATPSSPPPVPPSPTKSIIEHIPQAVLNVRDTVQQNTHQEVIQNGNELLIAVRAFLSNSRNIWSLTAVFELIYVVYSTVSWSYIEIPLSPRKDTWAVSLAYPPMSTFQATSFWITLFHWAIPTLIIPTVLGSLISFSPVAPSPPLKDSEAPATQPVAPLDPLSASIIRLVAQIAYPYESLAARNSIAGLDVMGSNGRILSASAGLAFAFAEAIQGAPKIFAKTLVAEQRKAITVDYDESPVRKIMHTEEISAEVD